MKHIKAAWIEQLIEFDTGDEMHQFFEQLKTKKKQYEVIWVHGTNVRLKIQYNNNSMNMEEGE